ncbi:MAG: glycosyltransferase family 9 protein [Verrucomicrobiota bacterium]|nr:glycosyltransferase family 9 protein [Verrucomicrobiota bacterium]
MVLFLPFLKALRLGYPGAHIAGLFSSSNGADLLLKSVDQLVNEVIVLNLKGRSRFSRLLAGIKAGLKGWDMTIIRFNGVKAEVLLAGLVGRSRWRVGHCTTEEYRNRWNNFLNIKIEMDPGTHEVDRYLGLARGLKLEVPGRLPFFQLSEITRQHVRSILSQAGLNIHQFVALVPGSSGAQTWKRWPQSHWVELVRLLEKQGIHNVLIGSAEETSLCKQILSDAGGPKSSAVLAGRLNLIESIALCEAAKTVICCDSGLMHLSAAVNTPVVSLFGPTDETRTGPLGNGHIILRAGSCHGRCFSLADPMGHTKCNPEQCMNAIEPSKVCEATLKQLGTPHFQSHEVVRFKLNDL